MTPQDFTGQLAMVLRDQPHGTSADLTPFALAWWDGHGVVFAFLDGQTGQLDEEFCLDDYQWADWEGPLCAWFDAPAYSTRADVLEWLRVSPPHDAG
jgi:hypothetical protein